MTVVKIQPLFVLQKFKVTRFLNILRQKDFAKILVFLGFISVALLLGVGTYFFSRFTFSFLGSYPEILKTLLLYIFLVFFFLIFILVLGSSIISAIGILFTADDDNLLLSLPISIKTIFAERLFNLTIIASWPVIIFGIPFLLAFKESFEIDILGSILTFIALFFILLIATFLASIIAIGLTTFTGKFFKKITPLITTVALPLFAWWTITLLVPHDLIESLQRLELYQISNYLQSLPLNSGLLPSTWAANFVLSWGSNPLLASINFLKLLIAFVALYIITRQVTNRQYYESIAKTRVGHFIAGTQDIVKPVTKVAFPHFFKGIKGAFFEKDVITLARNRAELLQGGFILFLIILYFLALSRVPQSHLEKALPNLSIVFLIRINFAVVAFILSIFALRFIFPSISLEGQSAWLIWTAPFSKAKIYWEKLITSWFFLSFIGIVASVFSTQILKLNFIHFISQSSLFVACALAITSINLSLGAILPNFSEKNAEKLSTSKGGLVATFLTLTYIFVVNIITFTKTTSFLITSSSQLFVWLISLVLFGVLSFVSLNKVERYQF